MSRIFERVFSGHTVHVRLFNDRWWWLTIETSIVWHGPHVTQADAFEAGRKSIEGPMTTPTRKSIINPIAGLVYDVIYAALGNFEHQCNIVDDDGNTIPITEDEMRHRVTLAMVASLDCGLDQKFDDDECFGVHIDFVESMYGGGFSEFLAESEDPVTRRIGEYLLEEPPHED